MASVDNIVARIKRRLSRKNDANIGTDIIDELASAQERFEDGPTLPRFLIAPVVNTGLSAETLDLSTLTGFLRLEEKGIYVQDPQADPTGEQYVPVYKEDYDVMISRNLGSAQDAQTLPKYYALVGNVAYFRPIPYAGTTFNLRIFYYRRDPTAPIAGGSTLWCTNLPTLMMAEAGREISKYLRDDAALKYFEARYQEAYSQNFLRPKQAFDDSAQEMVMGGLD